MTSTVALVLFIPKKRRIAFIHVIQVDRNVQVSAKIWLMVVTMVWIFSIWKNNNVTLYNKLMFEWLFMIQIQEVLVNRMVIQGIQHRAPLRVQPNQRLLNHHQLRKQHPKNRATVMQNVKVKVLWPIQTIAGRIHFQHIQPPKSFSNKFNSWNVNLNYFYDSKFYRCVDNGKGGFNKYEFECGPGTVWDQDIQGCNYASQVKGCGGSNGQPVNDSYSQSQSSNSNAQSSSSSSSSSWEQQTQSSSSQSQQTSSSSSSSSRLISWMHK